MKKFKSSVWLSYQNFKARCALLVGTVLGSCFRLYESMPLLHFHTIFEVCSEWHSMQCMREGEAVWWLWKQSLKAALLAVSWTSNNLAVSLMHVLGHCHAGKGNLYRTTLQNKGCFPSAEDSKLVFVKYVVDPVQVSEARHCNASIVSLRVNRLHTLFI